MRDILFKAKRKNWQKLSKEEQWIYGYYVQGFNMYEEPMHMIFDTLTRFYVQGETDGWEEIDPDTLCQYTGLTDKNGNKRELHINKALDVTVAYVEKTATNIKDQYILVSHSDREEYALKLKEMLESTLSPKEVLISDVFSACGTNIGPGMVGVYFLGDPISADLEVEKNTINTILGKTE